MAAFRELQILIYNWKATIRTLKEFSSFSDCAPSKLKMAGSKSKIYRDLIFTSSHMDELNPGRLVVKSELYLCAMPSLRHWKS